MNSVNLVFLYKYWKLRPEELIVLKFPLFNLGFGKFDKPFRLCMQK